MHTFFINTAENGLAEYKALFDIHRENKELVSINCPFKSWYDRSRGYLGCVDEISDMIDGYADIKNIFNLIIYIDLSDNEKYLSEKYDLSDKSERDEYYCAMRIVYTHAIYESIIKELYKYGRKPAEVLIMFGEDKNTYETVHENISKNNIFVKNKVLELIGLPTEEKINELLEKCNDDEAIFKNSVEDVWGEGIVPVVKEIFSKFIESFCISMMNGLTYSEAVDSSYEEIKKSYRNLNERFGLEEISCPYDRTACQSNKLSCSLRQLNIAIYLLSCLNSRSIYLIKDENEIRRVMPFRVYAPEEIAGALNEKRLYYINKMSEIDNLNESYHKLDLTPSLSGFNNKAFGLNELGNTEIKLFVLDVKDDDNNENGEVKKREVAIKRKEKEIEDRKETVKNLFTKEEYSLFDYEYKHECDVSPKRGKEAEQYEEKALDIRKHHMEYLEKIKAHITSKLSNYAGKSLENKAALLEIGKKRYKLGDIGNKSLEEVNQISENALSSMQNQYMEFCAGRAVEKTDIKRDCETFISRLYQIKESLSKLIFVGIGLLFGIFIMYFPFLMIQDEEIMTDFRTKFIAFISVIVPLALVLLIFTTFALKQRRKFKDEWEAFKKRSDDALKNNTSAAENYDHLLAVVIPSLRWVYEYKLDVDYYEDCCKSAKAKIQYHYSKLNERVTEIDDILSDIGYKSYERIEGFNSSNSAKYNLDYNEVFCTGKNNREFYSIIDKHFFTDKK